MDALGVVGLNVTLKVGGITQEVTVSATPPMLRTADGRLGQTIRNDVYTALPLVMNTGGPRDPTAFMFLMPGVQSIGRWGNVMGGQDFTNETYVEGVPITNAVVQGEGRNLSFGISVEAIDQFQVETSGTAVMYSGQGASNYVVKSGTNQFRGSAFEFFRNKGLDTKAFFAAAKPDDNQHEYGFTLGGPLRRNQAFFFVAYDGYRDRRQTESRLISIPTRGATQRRLQRAAGRHLRSGDDAAQPERHRLRPRSVPRQHHPGQPHLADLAQLAVVPARPTNGGLQNNYLGGLAADRVQQRQRHRQGRPAACRRGTRSSVLFAHGKRSQATPYRGGGNAQTAAAAALHRDTPRRRDSDHGAGEAHLRDGSRMGEPGQPRVRAAVGADLQRHGRRPLPDRGRHHAACPPARPTPRSPRSSFAGPNAPTNWRGTDARAFTEYLNNYTLQDNLQWTPGKHARDVRLPGAAHGRQRARAHLRQPGDVRLQQLADGRLQPDWHAATRRPATPTPASCSAS